MKKVNGKQVARLGVHMVGTKTESDTYRMNKWKLILTANLLTC